MPRLPRNEEEICEARERIMESALSIICDEGYENLTMRKLGISLRISAKTIYNYFKNKEEIYLRILTKGFEALNALTDESLEGVYDPVEKLRILSGVYIRFGLENNNYYDLMFNSDVPKYTNYLGTSYESVAKEQKDTAMHFAVISEVILLEILTGKRSDLEGEALEEAIAYYLVRNWSILHGYVSLHNSYSFREYRSNTLMFQKQIIEETVRGLG